MRLAHLTPEEIRNLPPIGGGAMELYRWTYPAIAASAIRAGDVVALLGAPVAGSGAFERMVIPVATSGFEPFGISLATANYAAATPPFTSAVPVVDRGNTIKVTAGASLGVGADVGIGSAGGSLMVPLAGIAGSVMWRVGKSVSPAASGETFALYVDPRVLSGTP